MAQWFSSVDYPCREKTYEGLESVMYLRIAMETWNKVFCYKICWIGQFVSWPWDLPGDQCALNSL